MSEIVNGCFCQWKVGGERNEMEDIKKEKENVWGVVFTNVFSFFLRILCCCFGSTLGTEAVSVRD